MNARFTPYTERHGQARALAYSVFAWSDAVDRLQADHDEHKRQIDALDDRMGKAIESFNSIQRGENCGRAS